MCLKEGFKILMWKFLCKCPLVLAHDKLIIKLTFKKKKKN
jgi:hypothetical protein